MNMIRLASTAVLFLSTAVAWAVPPVFSTNEGAIRGYDPVAYVKQQQPVKGDRNYTVRWNGADWYFASAANRDAFKADPERYAPQYGGYCAYGVAQGYAPPTDPSAFRVVDGKLYLNLSPYVAKKWDEDIQGNVRDANKNWPSLVD